MENETTSGFGSDSSDKVTTVVDEKINGGGGTTGLCLKLQRTESFPYKMMMMNQNRSNEIRVGSGCGGPTAVNGSSDGSRLRSDIYDAPGVGGGGSSSSGGGAVARTLQPFNSSSFKSPAAGMAATLKFPFTSAQWQELERQALIYKYMISCVPIPPDLLIPISRNHSEATVSHSTLSRSSGFNLRFSNNTDPEPGRCRRTDGKKWRCSRDVAPDQKYCERHMHRGRPRSRKHVEVQTEINNKINLSVPSMALTTNTTKSYNLPSGFSTKPDFKVPPFETMASASPYKDTRSMEWMMKRESIPMAASNQQWEQLMNSKTGLRTNSNNSYPSTPVFQQQQYQETLNLNSYTDFGGSESSETQQQSDQFCLFLNPELTSLDENLSSDQRQTPRRFIDAWSTATDSKPTETNNKSSVFASNKFSPSNLSLSMSGCNSTEEEIDQIEMGLGVKSQTLSWMTPVSWMASQPGGPLAEVLQSSTSTSKSSINGGGLNLMTDGWVGSNAETSSPRVTTISSPSGVLQKTLASLSDSSGSSSPNSLTAAAAAVKSEIALQLLNQSKFQSSS
ncbi:WRC [Macleaya cordata]|uniref:Growth-regulating factor n=1 Tax=Macleaya cordata TaxID=56857 RepID=A0A200Q2N9_MACCD|nr:WRC [Macleaya cordata]